MLKKLSVILFLALFLVSSLAMAANVVKNSRVSDRAPQLDAKLFLNDDGSETMMFAPTPKFGSYSTAQTFAPSRQVLGSYTTTRDIWHNTCCGRQIAFGGYYNASCEYVYIDWPAFLTVGSTNIQYVFGAFFDWTLSDWNFDVGVTPVAPQDTRYPNMGVDIKSGNPIASYHGTVGANAYYSMAGFASCSDLGSWTNSQTPGAPNLESVQTGYCGDASGADRGYIWPHEDVDTNAAGETIVHLATEETTPADCTPADNIEASSFIYYRKVGANSWDGPHFIDSGYVISQIVVADHNGPNVYYCYPKPLYYEVSATPHPCAGPSANGYYQFTNDIAYRMSTDDGASWGPVVKVTDYIEGFMDGLTDASIYDMSAMVDPDGNLHMVWFSNNWEKDPADGDICGANSGRAFAGKLWHYDTGNDCISIAYDASHPAYFTYRNALPWGTFRTVVTKPSISWCDDKVYIAFERYGAHPVGDTSFEVGAGNPSEDTLYQVADVMVVGSDATGNLGQTWTNAINLTDTYVDSCLPGDCFSEVWPTMSRFSTDSLMIDYLEDKDPGIGYSREEGLITDNPVVFMTWPCFTMASVGSNPQLSASPSNTVYSEIGLAPNGNTTGCTTPATYDADLVLSNTGNVSLTYTTSSNAGWLTVTGGSSGAIPAGAGPRNADAAGWDGAPGCASPATVSWQASSSSLGSGNYSGAITVDVSDPSLDDIVISVNLAVACEYYLPEYATISGGCWTIDLFNTPQAGNGSENNNLGNMKFYSCGDTISPLYTEAMIIGWKVGSDIYCYTDNSDNHMGAELPASLPSYQRQNARMRALGEVVVDSVGTPGSGSGYTFTTGYWCTPDSVVYGKTEYFVPGHQDTSVLIERISVWNESGSSLGNFLVGEGIDWDVRRDSNQDQSGIDFGNQMVYQYGSGPDANIYAGLAPYNGQDGNYGAATLANVDWIYPDTGYNIIDIYNYLTSLDGTFEVSDSTLADLNSVFRFYEGSLAANGTDTLVFCKVKAVSLDGLSGLQTLIDKGDAFIENYDLCPITIPPCQGRCGNANGDASVNVSDAVYVINFVFVGGNAPLPVKACGNANGDTSVNVSDAVYIINFVFVGGTAPGDCHPGVWAADGGDCCPY